jgi:hypothetical protein
LLFLTSPVAAQVGGATALQKASSTNLRRVAPPETLRLGPTLTLTQALTRPDATIVVAPDGTKATVGEIKRLRDEHARKSALLKTTKPPLTGGIARTASATGLAKVKAQSAAISAEMAAGARIRAAQTGGASRSRLLGAGMGVKTSALPGKGIWSVNGKSLGFLVSPGATLGIEGWAFGDTVGQVNVLGQFPSGAAGLRIVDWHDGVVSALLPAGMRGVPDHDVTIQLITREGKIYLLRGGKFVASREDVTLTQGISRVVTLRAEPRWTAALDDTGSVDRAIYYGLGNLPCLPPGRDLLTVRDPGRGFVVTGISAHWGRTDTGDGDGNGNPGNHMFAPGYAFGDWNGDTIEVKWGVWRSHTSPSIWLADPDVWCRSDYQIAVTLSGPAGVSPF